MREDIIGNGTPPRLRLLPFFDKIVHRATSPGSHAGALEALLKASVLLGVRSCTSVPNPTLPQPTPCASRLSMLDQLWTRVTSFPHFTETTNRPDRAPDLLCYHHKYAVLGAWSSEGSALVLYRCVAPDGSSIHDHFTAWSASPVCSRRFPFALFL